MGLSREDRCDYAKQKKIPGSGKENRKKGDEKTCAGRLIKLGQKVIIADERQGFQIRPGKMARTPRATRGVVIRANRSDEGMAIHAGMARQFEKSFWKIRWAFLGDGNVGTGVLDQAP